MMANRPDWCISSQRNWGVPIPVFYCKDCGEPLLNLEAIDNTEKQFLEKGSDSWYTGDISDFLPKGVTCTKCQGENFEKGRDIVDVWFESGASFNVLENRDKHQFPADMYLEGGDQYRGWFHSSLLIGVSAKKCSPYRTVITHGWVLDKKGRAMSKSLRNIIKPQTIIDQKGAEVLRLWVAMVNYREDIKLGDEILSRVTESYRKLRNTWKFMLGVLSDFDPKKDLLKKEDLRE
ncbi:MAG: class I tRNA ligase family protein, partial [bacterium]|nr:class I tRNA ligase family protein [bacterium]